jgi:glycine cleavage system regulatory protein
LPFIFYCSLRFSRGGSRGKTKRITGSVTSIENKVVDSTLGMMVSSVVRTMELVVDTEVVKLIQQVLGASTAASAPAPELSAYSSSTSLNGETVSTYLVTMKLSGQTLFEAHVSQLGQVLRAQMPLFGYKLAPHNITP